jgi:hypothetical protein
MHRRRLPGQKNKEAARGIDRAAEVSVDQKADLLRHRTDYAHTSDAAGGSVPEIP